MSGPRSGPVRIPDLINMKRRGEKIAMMTAYDHPTARILDEAGFEILLVGDSLGMVVLGYDTTLPVTMEEMLHHTRAVTRGTQHALVVGDMPYLSYQVSAEEAIRNAGRFVKEAGAQAVKVEGGRSRTAAIRAIHEAEIPVMGHVGLTPQAVHRMGGFKVQGKDLSAAREVLEEALAVEEAGAFSIVLEGIPAELSERITERLRIPTLGIGAGVGCDGQVLVVNDLLGLSGEKDPKFVRRYASLAHSIREAGVQFIGDVRSGAFPSDAESYHMKPEVLSELDAALEPVRRQWSS